MYPHPKQNNITIMKELKITIKQDKGLFLLTVRCESSELNKRVIKKVFGRYNEKDGVIMAGLAATNIVKLVSVQMILITELSENGQI